MPSPYAVRRPVENAFLVRQHDRKRLRELAGVAAAVLVLGGGLFAYTWVHVEMLRTGYRVDELEKNLQILLEKERQLRLEAAVAAHPELIEQRAKGELGMVAPSLEQMIFYQQYSGQPGKTAVSAGSKGRGPVGGAP